MNNAIIKYIIPVLLLTMANAVWGQADLPEDKLKRLTASIQQGIWDEENSDGTIHIEYVSYDEIPKYLDFRGTVVECLKWTDKLGDNLLIQSVTGYFPWRDYDDGNSTSYIEYDKYELYAYLFRKNTGETVYKQVWRVYDYNECYGVDSYTGFIPHATTITDIDKNGISEISMPYVLICRGGVDPGDMKIIAYEGDSKYAIRGSTMPLCNSENPYGGEYSLSNNLKEKEPLRNFLIRRWESQKCEDGRFY